MKLTNSQINKLNNACDGDIIELYDGTKVRCKSCESLKPTDVDCRLCYFGYIDKSPCWQIQCQRGLKINDVYFVKVREE